MISSSLTSSGLPSAGFASLCCCMARLSLAVWVRRAYESPLLLVVELAAVGFDRLRDFGVLAEDLEEAVLGQREELDGGGRLVGHDRAPVEQHFVVAQEVAFVVEAVDGRTRLQDAFDLAVRLQEDLVELVALLEQRGACFVAPRQEEEGHFVVERGVVVLLLHEEESELLEYVVEEEVYELGEPLVPGSSAAPAWSAGTCRRE